MTEETGSAVSTLAAWAAEAEAAAGIARALVGTAFVPASLVLRDERKHVDHDGTVAQIAAVLLTGQELGLPPMAALRSVVIIPPGTGSPALLAVALRGILQARGHSIVVVETTDTRAIVEGQRFGEGPPMRSVWTLDRAKKLKLRAFNDPDGNWQKLPAAMLVARATAEVARWIASDALLGLPMIAEEIGDDGDGTEPGPGRAALAPVPTPTDGEPPRRRTASRSKPAAKGSRGAAGGPVQALPPPKDAGSAVGGNDGNDGAPGPSPAGKGQRQPTGPAISPSQRAALWAGLRRIGLTDRDGALGLISMIVGREIGSSNDLRETEARTVLEEITKREAKAAAETARQAQDADAEAPDAEPGEIEGQDAIPFPEGPMP